MVPWGAGCCELLLQRGGQRGGRGGSGGRRPRDPRPRRAAHAAGPAAHHSGPPRCRRGGPWCLQPLPLGLALAPSRAASNHSPAACARSPTRACNRSGGLVVKYVSTPDSPCSENRPCSGVRFGLAGVPPKLRQQLMYVVRFCGQLGSMHVVK